MTLIADVPLSQKGRLRIVSLMPSHDLGKFLVVLGVLLACLGAILWSGVGKGWLGRLPGDIHYARDSFSFHFPVVTCLLLSLVLTFVMWLLKR